MSAILRRLRPHLPFLALLLLAALIRLALLPQPGYLPDLDLHKSWGQALYEQGFEGTLTMPNSPVNYFPNYALTLYVFKGIYAFYVQVLHGADPFGSTVLTELLKLPATLADLGLGILLYVWAGKWARGTRRLVAPALYLLNPGVIYDTALWGQVDSLHTTLAVLAFMAWYSGHRTGAWVLMVAAMMTKLHAIVFLPLLLALALYDDGIRGFVRKRLPAILATAAIASLPLLLTLGPARLAVGSFGSVAKYPYLTMNAMNVWWPVSRVMGGMVRDDLGPVPMVYVGFAAFVMAAIAILDSWRRRRSELRTLEAAALLALAFFLFPTEIHERYIFPFFPFAALVAVTDRRWAWLTGVLAIGFLVDIFFAAEIVALPWLPVKLHDLMTLADPWFLVNLLCFFALLTPFLREGFGAGRPPRTQTV